MPKARIRSAFVMRLPTPLWKRVRQVALDRGISATRLVEHAVSLYVGNVGKGR